MIFPENRFPLFGIMLLGPAMKFLSTFQTADFFDTLISLAVAFVLGTLIGAERQYRQRTAGLRTNVLVAVGARLCRSRHASCRS